MLSKLSSKGGGTTWGAIGQSARGQRLSNGRSLHSTEGEIVGLLHLRNGERRDPRPPGRFRGKRGECCPAWIWGAEKACDLVEGFPCRIVNRAAKALYGSIALHPHQERMSARDHESDCGKGWNLSLIRIAQPSGAQMPFQVIDWEHREASRPSPRASNASPY
jgi:hypothetical protein